jgi:basic amino acid/polyamine antiporter, APA family
MTKLARILTFRDLTLLIIGSVIGSGIFLVPGTILNRVDGRVVPALMVWLVGGLLSLLGALTYGELSVVNPKAGGLYVHIRDCFGPLPAFLFGWTLFFAIGGGTVATLAVAFSATLGKLIPISSNMGKVIALAMILVVTVVNVIGTRTSADVQNWTTLIKAGAIILMSAALLIYGNGFQGAGPAMWASEINGSLASGFMLAMVSVLWAYEGWQYCTFSAGEIVNPQRDFPRAFLVGSVALIGIYLLANVAYLAVLGPAGVAGSESVAAESLTAVVNPTAAKLIIIAISISIFSAANSNVLTSPRVYYAMATDGLFFKQLAEVHPRFGTPAFAIIAGSLWSAVLAMSAKFNELLTLVVFSGWIFYALAAASIFVYRKRQPSVERSYSTPGYPITPLLFIIAAAVLIINTLRDQLATNLLQTLFALSVIVLGIPAYFIWRTHSKTAYRIAESSEAD